MQFNVWEVQLSKALFFDGRAPSEQIFNMAPPSNDGPKSLHDNRLARMHGVQAVCRIWKSLTISLLAAIFRGSTENLHFWNGPGEDAHNWRGWGRVVALGEQCLWMQSRLTG